MTQQRANSLIAGASVLVAGVALYVAVAASRSEANADRIARETLQDERIATMTRRLSVSTASSTS